MTSHLEGSKDLVVERQRLAAQRTRAIRAVLWWILLANWGVSAAKVVVGLVAGSSAVVADGLHSFIDGGSNVIGLIAMRYAGEPADKEHPYGHHKFEALASLAIGMMIGMGVIELGRMAFNAIVNNVRPDVHPTTFVVMVVTLIINTVVTKVEAAAGKRLGSSILTADAGHTSSDIFVSGAVIASLTLSYFGVGRADGFVAMGVLCVVAWTGWKIVRQAIGILSDSAQLDPVTIQKVCTEVPDVLAVRDVRSRGMEGAVYVDLKIDVDPRLSIERAHQASDGVEDAIARAFPQVIDVVVHVEPKAA